METIIKPTKGLRVNWRELKAYRELFFYFAWRDVKVRYKQTAIGASWAIFQPFITMVVFTLFFHRVAGIQTGSDDVPYAIFSFLGLLFWNYFSNALTRAGNSLVDNQAVVSKVYFPRIIPPVSSTIVSLIDFGFASIVYIGLMLFYGIAPTALGLLLFLPAVFLTFITALGPGLFLSAVNVKYRDIKQILPFLVQTGLFLTPVIYPVTLVPDNLQWLLYLNPMTAVINAMRSSMLGLGTINWELTALSVLSAFVMFAVGFIYFKIKEREFADII